MYSIFVAGAGYVGAQIAAYFRSKNQKVFALTRTEARHEELRRHGVIPQTGDLSREDGFGDLPDAHFIILAQAPSDHGDSAYENVYYNGTRNLLKKLSARPKPHLIVHLSSIGVMEEDNGQWVDEETEVQPKSRRSKILYETEQAVLKSGFPAIVLRLGGIYGPKRNRITDILSGQWPAAAPDRYLNMIHRDDIVLALHALMKHGREGNVYLGIDDNPVRLSEFYAWLASQCGVAPAQNRIDTRVIKGKRCRNEKIRGLGYQFVYPVVYDGYCDLIRQESSHTGL